MQLQSSGIAGEVVWHWGEKNPWAPLGKEDGCGTVELFRLEKILKIIES